MQTGDFVNIPSQPIPLGHSWWSWDSQSKGDCGFQHVLAQKQELAALEKRKRRVIGLPFVQGTVCLSYKQHKHERSWNSRTTKERHFEGLVNDLWPRCGAFCKTLACWARLEGGSVGSTEIEVWPFDQDLADWLPGDLNSDLAEGFNACRYIPVWLKSILW